MNSTIEKQALAFYRDEIIDHMTYLELANSEREPRLHSLLSRIAALELNHSNFWKKVLESRGAVPPRITNNRARMALLRLLQRFVNPALLVSALELGESNTLKRYFEYLTTCELTEKEKAALRGIIVDEMEHEQSFRDESRRLGLANVRDFVLGMNDGLVEILGAVAGLTAVYWYNPKIIAISGLIVGIAGALSMGIGAFISVRSQRQINEGAKERMEILFEVAPERAVAEYRTRLAESGVPQELAQEIATRVGSNRQALTQLLLPETEEHEVRSGLFTGIAYLFGIAFPVTPYFLASNALSALLGAVALAGLALALVGLFISLVSGVSLKRKIAEMLMAGFVAAAIAYLFGSLVQSLIGVEI